MAKKTITKKDTFIKAFSKYWPANRQDNYVNRVSGFGGTNDPLTLTSFSSTFTYLDYITLSNMYRHDWIARKYVNIFAEDATRKFINFTSDDVDLIAHINTKIDDLDIKEKFQEALVLARLYGGSVIIVGAIDGQEITKPLNEDNIREIKYLTVLDRWQVHVAKTFGDPMEPNYGKPELYSLQPLNTGYGYLNSLMKLLTHNKLIHSSRVIRFDGAYLPDVLRIANQGWHDSVLVNLESTLKKYGVSIHSISILFQDFVLKILKTKGLAEKLSSDTTKAAIEGRVALIAQNLSSSGIALIDQEDEDFEKKQSPVSGLDKLFEKVVEITCGATTIPRSRLFTQQMGKLAGATEETKTYYNGVGNYQNSNLYNQTKRMLELLLLDKSSPTNGRIPKNWSFGFNSLWETDEKTEAETRKLTAETDEIYIQNGVVTPEEITASRFTPIGYSSNTTIDWDLKKDFEKETGK